MMGRVGGNSRSFSPQASFSFRPSGCGADIWVQRQKLMMALPTILEPQPRRGPASA